MRALQWENYLWDEPHPASLEDMERLEYAWGVRLPAEYKAVVSQHQGMTPVPNAFKLGRTFLTVTTLLTVGDVPRWGQAYSAAQTREQFKHFIPEGVFPFAMTPTGEHLCFDYRDSPDEPRVAFLSVEAELISVANGFTEFLEGLRPLEE